MYQFREVELKNKKMIKKVLVIEFDQEDMAIVAEFLMTDASLLDYSILRQIDKVLSGEHNCEKANGNRFNLVIKPDTTRMEDLFEGLFDDFVTYPTYEMSTKTLRELIVMWRDKKDTFERKY